jgi:excisionase family DNA binding protein|tara:strand:- start:846 stop:1079 length:234 start_codon:yes stop_codon:yes gene_type:complete
MNDILIPIIEKLESLERLIKKTTKADNELMTIKEVAKYSSMSEVSVRRAVQKGVLKPFKESGKKLFRIDAVDRWLNN